MQLAATVDAGPRLPFSASAARRGSGRPGHRGAMAVVVALPLPEHVVEDPGVVDDGPDEKAVELLNVDPVACGLTL